MKTVKFGIIGCGLMGREFASAAARWMHLNDEIARPEIVAVCDTNQEAVNWFSKNISSVSLVTADYKELLEYKEVEAVYCAVPHNMHKQLYVDIINAKKHFMGEKPFGMDMAANKEIMQAVLANPDVVVRCTSQFPFYPACQELIRWVKEGKVGRIIEVNSGINHSSDLDLSKPINWKRKVEINGEYGCMGDLGIHTQHIPFRLGLLPKNVFAKLENIAKERPDGKGNIVPCLTWDNATLICDAEDSSGNAFPIMFEMKRMKPGATNDWYIEIHGLDCSVRFSTDDANAFYYTQSIGKEQAWCRVVIGNKPQYSTITGGIFEFGFADAILQMWAAFMLEIEGKNAGFGCFKPEETIISHRLQTAALESARSGCVIKLQ